MKRLLLAPFKLLWRATAPARESSDARLNMWFYSRIAPRVKALAAESTPGLDALVRELVRLQHRVDELEAKLAAAGLEERAKAG